MSTTSNKFLFFQNQQQQQVKMHKNLQNDFNTLKNSLNSEHEIYQYDDDICKKLLGEPENFSLRHIKGKLQINKSSDYSSNTNQETSRKIYNDSENNMPILDFSAYPQYSSYFYEQQLNDNEFKVNFRPSNFLNKSRFQSNENAYIHLPHSKLNYQNESSFYYQELQKIQIEQLQNSKKILAQPKNHFEQDNISSTPIVNKRTLSQPSNPMVKKIKLCKPSNLFSIFN